MDHDHEGPDQGENTKNKRVTKMCCVPQCSNKADVNGLSFYHFPKEDKRKKMWETALRMGKPASSSMVVCSEHFKSTDFFPGADQKKLKRLKQNTVPSEKIPVRPNDRKVSEEQQEKKQKRADRAKKRLSSHTVNEVLRDKEDSVEKNDQAAGNNLLNEHLDHQGDNDLNPPKQPVLTLTKSCQTLSTKPTLIDMITDEQQLKNLTGLHSFELLEGLQTCVNDLIKDRKRSRELCLRSRIILCFVKLKINCKFTTLAILFNITRQSCTTYFKETIPLLRVVLETMLPWPDHEPIRENIPIAFKNYKDTRIVLDCAETPIEKSKCLKCRILTWSNYKGKQTAKFDVGVAPSGLITHLSRAYGGRASDKFIVTHSGILDKLIYKDGVMADKGFKIEGECLERNLIMYRPPFVYQKKQMSRADAIRCAEIARARVHVERVIQRIREFMFVCDAVPWELLPWLDDILIISAGIVNLGPPVLNVDKFL